MKFYKSLLKKSYVAKIGVLVVCIILAYLLTGKEVNAQLKPPCVDSTPACPCILADDSCMDIDTPIDNEVFILVIAAISLALYKLHVRKVI